MEITKKELLYISFLETINKALDVETLFEDTFKIIKNIFEVERVQLWEKISNTNEMSVLFDYFDGNEISMLKFRLPLLAESTKKIIEKNKLWEYKNIKEESLTKYNINSLTGIEFTFPEQNKGILILTSHKNEKKYSNEDINFLIKLKKELENGIFKVQKYQKSQEDIKRLQNQNNRLREQDRLRTNFLNNISHELKTPLASIIGFSKMLSSKKLTPETTKEVIEQINLASQRLSNLVTDFLQINKIDIEGWFAHIEPCDIGELIKQTTDEFASLNKTHKLFCNIAENHPVIKTDPKLVRHVLDNLISNAIKYSPHGAQITVTLQSFPHDKELKVSVIDSGFGIDKEEVSKIFNRFYRSQNPEVQKTSGSGLGLSICKEIITTLNGTIEVESELNKGSKFSFTLPVV